jgi:hypothetical protein
MEQFTVNRFVLKLSWLFLCIWVISMGMIIVFLAMGSPLWIYMFSSIIFFYFWIVIAATYPKTVIMGNDSIAFQLPGSDKIQTFKHDELEFSAKKGYYELAVSGTKRRKKFWISTKDIPAELEASLQKFPESHE